MRREQEAFTAAGLAVVLIGLGEPEQAQAFRAALKLPFPVLADPEKHVYHAYALTGRLNLAAETNAESARRLVTDTLRYGAARSPDQDMLQLGGAFLIDHGGIMRFAHRSARATDYPRPETLLAAAKKL